MTAISRTMTNPAATSELATGFAKFAQAVRSTVMRRWKLAVHLRQARRLSELDDHMLRDLGLHRGDIYTALRCDRDDDATQVLSQLARRNRNVCDF